MSKRSESGDKNVPKCTLNGIMDLEWNVKSCPPPETSNLSKKSEISLTDAPLIDQIIRKLKSCEVLLFDEADKRLNAQDTTVVTTSVDISLTKKTDPNEESVLAHLNNEHSMRSNENSSALDHQSDQIQIDQLYLESEHSRNVCDNKSRTIFDPDLVMDIANPASSSKIEILRYENESQLNDIIRLITRDLSEPYSIYTYRYFIHNWPHLCFLARAGDLFVGAIVCKLALHGRNTRRGYIAMLAVDENYRRLKIGTKLVTQAIEAMVIDGCDEVVLETEVTNKSAMKLYENLGFVRDKRLFRYYWNGVDAFRLKLWLRSPDFLQYL